MVRFSATALTAAVVIGALWFSAGASGRSDATRPTQLGSDELPLIGFTQPFRKATLSSVRPGRIERVAVIEGARVTPGDIVVELDAETQRVRTEIARLEAESDCRVKLAEVVLADAQREMDRLLQMSRGAATPQELARARTRVDEAAQGLEIARLEHAQAVATLRLQQRVLEELLVRAPFAGYIAARLKEDGEAVEEREGILELVQLDPLLVTVDCPLELADAIQCGDTVKVLPADPTAAPRTGEVVFTSRVADAASQTFKIKLEVANADSAWLAGQRVQVVLTPSGADSPLAAAQPKTGATGDE